MSILKSMLGSVIGAGVATGVLYGLKNFVLDSTQMDSLIWFPLATGILTGGMARWFQGPSLGNGASMIAGAVAGLIAGFAMFGVDVIPNLLAQEKDYGPLSLGAPIVASSDRGTTTANDAVDENDGPPDEPSASDEGPSADQGQPSSTEGTTERETDPKADPRPELQGSDDQPIEATSQDELNEMFLRRGAGNEAALADHSNTSAERYAELIKKPRHQSWFNTFFPYILNGIGILLAYQIARGFGKAPKKG